MFVRVCSSEGEDYHFEEITVPMGPVGKSPIQPAMGITFYHGQPGDLHDWHNAPWRQYVITLSGQVEFTIGDGPVKRLGPGDLLLAENLTDRGDITRVADTKPRISVAIPLA